MEKFEFSDLVFENSKKSIDEYSVITKEIKRDIIKSLTLAKSGHSGGSLGISEILTVLYFGNYMKYNPKEPNWSERDRFVLSAGHLAPVLYSVLARANFFPPNELSTLRKYNSRLQGHPGLDMHLPGIETSTGSLGQGVSIAVGMAISDKVIDNNKRNIFCLTGDGELQEGATWEAAMAAGSLELNNLCWIVDNNDCQIDGRVKDIMSVYPIKEKFQSFNFNVIEIDGHNYEDIERGFNFFLENAKSDKGKPTCIIATTFMGNGISFMQDKYQWHGNPPKPEQAIQALKELE
ncbi:MAG TPA: transketolase [Candidatus Kapabacteria bacterium]|nr:transketolase [Candidatus Kapabacteria bacterium]